MSQILRTAFAVLFVLILTPAGPVQAEDADRPWVVVVK